MDNNQEETIFTYQIHYYFNDESHSMDASIQNKAEKSFIEVLKKIEKISESDIQIEITPLKEGGLIELFVITVAGSILTYLKPAINDIITYHFTKNNEQEKLDTKIKEETLKGIQLDNEKKKTEQKLLTLLYNKEINRDVSNFYKQVNKYQKITHIGFQGSNKLNEKFVRRDNFSSYIIEDINREKEDDNATIEIISPVLNSSTNNWRGIYKGSPIDFSMGDTKFKNEIVEGKYKFANGSNIVCILNISSKFDDDGEKIGKDNYSVKSVLEVNDIIGNRTTNKGRKKYKSNMDNMQMTMFDDNIN